MNHVDTIPRLSPELRLALAREELHAQGRSDAFKFALEHQGDLAAIQSEIETFEGYVTNPPEVLQRAMSPNTSVRLHADGYLPGLEEALRIILDGKAKAPRNGAEADNALPDEIANVLNHEQCVSKGHSDAFLFAQKCYGHTGVLRAAIQDSEEFLSSSLDAISSSMDPRFSRGFYEQGYQAGLRDALRILAQAASSSQSDAISKPARAPALAIAEERSQYDATSEPAASSESAPPDTSKTRADSSL